MTEEWYHIPNASEIKRLLNWTSYTNNAAYEVSFPIFQDIYIENRNFMYDPVVASNAVWACCRELLSTVLFGFQTERYLAKYRFLTQICTRKLRGGTVHRNLGLCMFQSHDDIWETSQLNKRRLKRASSFGAQAICDIPTFLDIKQNQMYV